VRKKGRSSEAIVLTGAVCSAPPWVGDAGWTPVHSSHLQPWAASQPSISKTSFGDRAIFQWHVSFSHPFEHLIAADHTVRSRA
jgi:hypothetical protein